MATTSIVSRLRSSNPVIDMRQCDADAVVDLTAFETAVADLKAFGAARNLRVWVLHEAADRWTDNADLALKAIRRLYDATKTYSGQGPIVDAAVLVGAAKNNRPLAFLLRSIGVAPFPLRDQGGLPVHEIDLGEGLWAGMTPPTSPGNQPREPVLSVLFEEADGGEDNAEAIAEHVAEALSW